MKHLPAIVVALLLFLHAGAARAAEVKPLEIGAKAPDFTLPGVDGKTYSLKDFGDARILAIIFTSNHCPAAQAYEERIKQLYADYKGKGVALVAINPNDPLALRLDELGYTDVSDSFDDMKFRAKDHDFQFPYLYDGETQKTSHEYGVLATPHVFIFDAERKLRYVGRIDDSDVKEVKSHDARNAIDALLAGKAVPAEKTKVFGCSTKWAEKREDAKKSLAKWDAEPVIIEPADVASIKAIAENADSKKLRLINVWATWCGPCVAELPELVEMNRMYRKRPFEFITVSTDDPEKKDGALATLKENHVAARNLIYTGDGQDALVAALDKNWEGPVPFTVLIAPGGKVLYRHNGPIEPLEVKRAIVSYLGRTYASK